MVFLDSVFRLHTPQGPWALKFCLSRRPYKSNNPTWPPANQIIFSKCHQVRCGHTRVIQQVRCGHTLFLAFSVYSAAVAVNVVLKTAFAG